GVQHSPAITRSSRHRKNRGGSGDSAGASANRQNSKCQPATTHRRWNTAEDVSVPHRGRTHLVVQRANQKLRITDCPLFPEVRLGKLGLTLTHSRHLGRYFRIAPE